MAAMILRGTRTIADQRLWHYACPRFSGDMPPPTVKGKHGPSAEETEAERLIGLT